MKNRRTTICVMAVVVCLSTSQVSGLVEFKDGGIHNIDYEINDHVRIDYLAPGRGTTVNLLTGANISDTKFESYEDSIVKITGGHMTSDPVAWDNSRVFVSGGKIDPKSYYILHNGSQITVSGGSVRGIDAYDNSAILISDGIVEEFVLLAGDSRVNVSGGELLAIDAVDRGQVAVEDGSVSQVTGWDEASVSILGGVFGHVDSCDESKLEIGAVSVNVISTWGQSQAKVAGASVSDYLWARDQSHASISSGEFGSVVAWEDAQVYISGGNPLGLIESEHAGILTLVGSGFEVDDVPFGYGELTSVLGGDVWDDPYRWLSGTLLSGEPLRTWFRIGHDARIVLVPELTTFLLLGLGAVLLRRKR